MGWFDKLLAVGSTFDWISPTAELLTGAEYAGGGQDYADCERKARELRAQGIEATVKPNGVWGWVVVVNR